MPKIEVEDTEYNQLKADLAAKDAELSKLKTPPKEDEPKVDPKTKGKETEGDDDDLLTKSKKEKQTQDEKQIEMSAIESALKFNLGINEFVKTNAGLLPVEVADILKAAEKEKYDSVVEKSNAVKSAILQSFFSVQSNVDSLTAAQKNNLDNYLGLTKIAKEEKANFMFENIFEPAIEMMKKLKKAEELGKSNNGFKNATDKENAYKERLTNISQKAHLGEKGAS